MRFSRVFPLVALPRSSRPAVTTATVRQTLHRPRSLRSSATGSACSFTNNSTDSDGTIDAYDWDFGDQSAQVTTRHAAHTYAGPGGRFTVTLIVTDGDGETGTATEQVDVSRGVVCWVPRVGPSACRAEQPGLGSSHVYLHDEMGGPCRASPWTSRSREGARSATRMQ